MRIIYKDKVDFKPDNYIDQYDFQGNLQLLYVPEKKIIPKH